MSNRIEASPSVRPASPAGSRRIQTRTLLTKLIPNFGATGIVPLLVGSAAGIVGLGLYALKAHTPLRVFAAGLLLALAAGGAGGLIGFLFGVPRSTTLEGGKGGGVEGAAVGSVPAAIIQPSTNLEQISDWLTKILLGATLVQLGTVGSGAARLFRTVAPALGGSPDSEAFAGALLIYFAVLGFLIGWLSTRLILGKLMRSADEAAMTYFAQATAAEVARNLKAAEAYYFAGAMSADVAGNKVLAEQLRTRGDELKKG